MSDPTVAIVAVVELLPPVVVPPLTSLVAPVVAVRVVEPGAVGVPETAHEMLAPAAIVAGVDGVQTPMVTPGGRPLTEQVAAVALAVAVAAFVHLSVPEYGVPTVAVVGRPEMSGTMSEPTAAMSLVAELLPPVVVPPLMSLVAPVATVTVVVPVAVGVPETEQEMLAPAATVAGGVGEQTPTVTPGGRPEIEQDAAVALVVAVAELVHFTVPL